MQIILASAKIMNDKLKSVPDISYEGFAYEPTLGELDFPHFISGTSVG